MKKFLFILFFLALLGAAGFFFGWPHLTVPVGSYGVMQSKTHGLDSRVIEAGEFRWVWYKLIPTNVEITAFTLDKVQRPIRSYGSLGSGQVYADLAGLEADFSWEIRGELSFSLKPGILPEFTARENIHDNAGLRTAERQLAERIENLVLQRLRAYANEEDGLKMERLSFGTSLEELDREIELAFPEIENLSCVIQVLSFPDYALYQSLKALYHEYLSRQSAVLSVDIARDAERRIDMNIRLDELARYGDLLTRYPILLHYLALEKGFFPEAGLDVTSD